MGFTGYFCKWHNRIVGSGLENPADILQHPLNIRIHSIEQLDALEAVLRSIGWVDEIIINRTTGRLLDGHARVSVALRAGETLVPVSYIELDADEEALALGSFDRISDLAQIDAASLGELMHGVSTDEPALLAMLSSFAESAGVVELGDLGNPESDLQEELERASTTRDEATQSQVAVKIGDTTFQVSHADFDCWQEDARSAVGFDKAAIVAYMLGRLDLEVA